MLNITVIILMITTLVIIATGTLFMVKGGKINRKYSNKMMMARIAFHALAFILLLVIAYA